jgi:hypothetical protein
MLLGLEQLDRLGTSQIDDLPVDPETYKSLAASPIDHITKLSRLIADKGRKKHQPSSLRPGENFSSYLLRRLAANSSTRLRVMWHSDRGIKNTKIIIDFGRGSDRRTRIGRGDSLLDRDCR